MKTSALPFYNLLSDSGRSVLEHNLKSLFCAKGQLVRENGGELYGMIYVEDGILSVSLLSEDGREVTLSRLRKGEYCFLPSEPISGINFDLNAEAESDVRISVLATSAMALLLEKDPSFYPYFHKSMMANFAKAVKLLQSVLFCTFDQRLASFLYREMRESGSTTLALTHEQIARHIGSAREVVSRTLKQFSARGIVSVSRGSITVLDKEKLKTLIC